MNIEAMAQACGMMAYTDVTGRLQIDGDNGKITEFAALVRTEALREAAGICTLRESDNYHDYKDAGSPLKGSERSEAHSDEAANCAAAILAAIDQPKEG